MIRRTVLPAVLVALVVLVTPAVGAAKSTPAELKGCRLLAAAYDTSAKGTVNERVALSMKALARFRDTRDGDLLAIVRRPVSPTFSFDLGAWCTEHYPNDHAVRHAEFPTPPTRV